MAVLTPAQIAKGFWYYRPEAAFPPNPIADPSDYTGGENLSIACTQLADAALQRRLVRSWCDALPRLETVRFLWFVSRVPQDLFDSACSAPALRGLSVKWSGAKTLAALKSARDLEYLCLGSSPSVRDPEVLGSLTRLVVLDVENIPALFELDILRSLSRLEELGLHGSMYKTQEVASLAPLATLKELTRLSFTNLRAQDLHSLRALASLPSLERLILAKWWPPEDIAYVCQSRPSLRLD